MEIEDEVGHVTTQTWAAFGRPDDRRLVSVEDARGKTWAYSYTTAGQLTGVTPPDGPSRSWTYGAASPSPSTTWLRQEVHPESGTVDYTTYDAVGRLKVKEVRGTGETIGYDYDANGRLKTIDPPGTAHDVTFGYDGRDNRTSVVNGTVSTTILYDLANRPYRRTDVIAGESFVTKFTYDARDNLETVEYPSGRVITYEYDNADRMTKVRQGAGASLVVWAQALTYEPWGALKGYTAANGTGTTIGYDTRLRPASVDSGPLSLDYTYDLVGNVRAITDARPEWSRAFCYDAVDRLTHVGAPGLACTSAPTFTYDARGNRLTGPVGTYAYAPTTDRLTSVAGQLYAYNGVGSVASAGGQTYTYTPFQQVATAATGGATTTYGYDGDQQRRLRVRSDGVTEYFVPGPGLVPLAEYTKAPGGALVLGREYIYAGDRLIASKAEKPELSWTDPTITVGVTAPRIAHVNELRAAARLVRARYGLPPVVAGADVVVGDEVAAAHLQAVRTAVNDAAPILEWPSDAGGALAQGQPIRAAHVIELRARIEAILDASSRPFFYHLDALGSVRAVTDETGGLVRRHEYGAFGEDLAPWLGADQRRFTGKDRDPETGLDYFAARYYGAGLGRFTSVDPKLGTELALEGPQRWNRYAYAGDRPTRIVDPDGRGWLSKLVKLAIKGGDVAATFADANSHRGRRPAPPNRPESPR